jgi:choline-sulfatase
VVATVTDDRPNVLWICTDQQRFDTLGCYGNDLVETPAIDGLAAEGVRFDRAYCQSPICAPSRASFLTGRYPRTTGCRQNGQAIPPDETLVTRALAEDGYVCGLSGKLHVSPANPAAGTTPPMAERRIDDGYAEYNWSHDPSETWPANEYQHWLRGKGVPYEQTDVPESEYVERTVPGEHHQTTWCAQKGVEFIEDAADFDEPWLYSVNVFDPHHPFFAPDDYLDRYLDRLEEIPLPEYEDGELDEKPVFQRNCHEGAYTDPDRYPFTEMDETDHRAIRAAYLAMVDLIDDQVERLLNALERTGQREDTLVIFMSDHGEMLGDHGIYLKGPFFYEEAVRVPLVVSWPGVVEAGETSEALVELVDLAPTLLDAAGCDRPPGVQGESFWPMLTGDADLDDHRDSVYCECYNAMQWQNDPKPYLTMVRDDRYKLVRAHNLDSGELYDLSADPGETRNRWNDPDYQDVKREMLAKLSDRMAETVDPLPERQAPW